MEMLKGLGLRPSHYSDVIKTKPDIDFFEIISENFMNTGGRPIHTIEKIRRDYPFAIHGVSLNIGSSDRVNLEYLSKLKTLIERIDPEIVSDHLCWTGAHSKNWHDLLPLPMTFECAQNVIKKVKQVQDYLGRQIALENASTYLRFKADEMSEWEFINYIVEKADCRILLDVNNVYVNSVNHHFDAYEFIRKIPPERVVQYHLAGHTNLGDFLFDTHDHDVIEPVWDLFSHTIEIIGARPFIIERDDNIPELNEIMQETDRAKRIVDMALSRRKRAEEYVPKTA